LTQALIAAFFRYPQPADTPTALFSRWVSHLINPLAARHNRIVYDMLFRSVSHTLRQFAQGSSMGFIAILHTWDQKLNRHLHIHCIVPSISLNHEKFPR
jgi:hypothetical protein